MKTPWTWMAALATAATLVVLAVPPGGQAAATRLGQPGLRSPAAPGSIASLSLWRSFAAALSPWNSGPSA